MEAVGAGAAEGHLSDPAGADSPAEAGESPRALEPTLASEMNALWKLGQATAQQPPLLPAPCVS